MVIFVRENLYESECKSTDDEQSTIGMTSYLLKKGVYSDWLYAFGSKLKPVVRVCLIFKRGAGNDYFLDNMQ